MRLHQLHIVLALAISLGSATISHAARLEGDPQQADRRRFIEHMRLAASDRLIEQDDEIAAYLTAQFNTIVLYDTEDGLPKSEERIAYELSFARAHRLHVVLGKATEPLDSSAQANRIHVASVQVRHPLAVAASSPQVPDDEIRDRLALWDRYGHDLILGVFFLHDDVFLIHTSVERQRHLYALAHETVPDWAVFGMIGEFGFDATADDVARYYDPNAFDDLIMLMYPLNIGGVTGDPLDSSTSADPDDDMRRYVQRYMTHMGEKFISALAPEQSVILVIQAFAYDAEPIGHVPRPRDIMIEARVGGDLLRQIAGQQHNNALAYFLWDGSRAGMFGLWQREDWIGTAEQVNRIDQLRDGAIDLNP